MRLKAIVATKDENAIEIFKNKIDFGKSKIQVMAWVKTGEQLFEAFGQVDPKIVIIDKDLDGLDAISCAGRIRALKEGCKIFAMGPGDDADFLYASLDIKVYGYIRKPLDPEKISSELEEVSRRIRRINPEDIKFDNQVAMRSLYFWKIMFETCDMAKDLKFLNNLMGIDFRPGKYRALLFRLDEMRGELPDFKKNQYYSDINFIQSKIAYYLNTYLYDYCYTIMNDFRFNGVFSIINYDPQYEALVTGMLEDVRKHSEEYSLLHYGMGLTLCVGNAYDDHTDLVKSREEAYSAAWARMHHGTGKTLFYHKKFEGKQKYTQQVETLVESMKLSSDTLNINDFHRNVESLFGLPDYVLTDYKMRDQILGFLGGFFEINGVVLSAHMDVEIEKERIRKELNFSKNFKDYKNTLLTNMDHLFEIVISDTEKQNIRPLRKAIKYIKDNYNKRISAESIAEVVNLSPVYFSRLFKEQTGVNMTDYINDYRMQKAKERLFQTDMTISEVAEAVGFQDQRYFSKRFHQATGMTPSEYRKQK